jgi:hypothetical protein
VVQRLVGPTTKHGVLPILCGGGATRQDESTQSEDQYARWMPGCFYNSIVLMYFAGPTTFESTMFKHLSIKSRLVFVIAFMAVELVAVAAIGI